MLSEPKLTARLLKPLRNMPNTEVLNVTGSQFQAPGWHDVIISHSIWGGFIEFKGPKTRLQAHQARIGKSVDRWAPSYVVRFLLQERNLWHFAIEDFDGKELRRFGEVGTDAQVVVKLLRELKALEEKC